MVISYGHLEVAMVVWEGLLGDWPLGLEIEKPKGTFCG